MLKKIYNEAEELRGEVTHRSALRLHSLLEDNKPTLMKALDEMQYKYILEGFAELAHGTGKKKEEYRDSYKRYIDLLLYNLSRYV